MADNKVTISIEAQNSEKAKQALKDIGIEAQGLGNKLKESSSGVDMMTKAWSALAGVISVSAIIAFFKSAIQAANEQEDASNRLANALRIQGTYTDDLSMRYQDLAKSLMSSTRFSDEAIEGMMQRLVAIGNVGPEAMDRVTRATLDLAAANKIDLASAGEIVAKTSEGVTRGLKQFGINIEENLPKAEKFAEALRKIEEKFGGTAQVDVTTFSGALSQMGNAWGEVMESIGLFIAKNPSLNEAIRNTTQGFLKAADSLNTFTTDFLLAQLNDLETEIRNLVAPDNPLLKFRNYMEDAMGDKRQNDIKKFQRQLAELIIQIEKMGIDIADAGALSLLTEEQKNNVLARIEEIKNASNDLHNNDKTAAQEIFDKRVADVESLRQLWSIYSDEVGFKRMEGYVQEQTMLQGNIDLKQKEIELGMWQNEQFSQRLAQHDAELAKYNFMIDTEKKANTSLWTEAGKMRDTFSKGISQMTMDWIKGDLDVKKSFEAIGEQMLKVLIDWAVQQMMNQALSAAMKAAEIATATATGSAVAAAWAPAAAMASLASFGANAAPAAAAITSTNALALAMAVPKAEEGGIIPGSPEGTLVIAGEKNKREAIIPLESSPGIGLGGGNTYNTHIEIHNPTGKIDPELMELIVSEVSYAINKESER